MEVLLISALGLIFLLCFLAITFDARSFVAVLLETWNRRTIISRRRLAISVFKFDMDECELRQLRNLSKAASRCDSANGVAVSACKLGEVSDSRKSQNNFSSVGSIKLPALCCEKILQKFSPEVVVVVLLEYSPLFDAYRIVAQSGKLASRCLSVFRLAAEETFPRKRKVGQAYEENRVFVRSHRDGLVYDLRSLGISEIIISNALFQQADQLVVQHSELLIGLCLSKNSQGLPTNQVQRIVKLVAEEFHSSRETGLLDPQANLPTILGVTHDLRNSVNNISLLINQLQVDLASEWLQTYGQLFEQLEVELKKQSGMLANLDAEFNFASRWLDNFEKPEPQTITLESILLPLLPSTLLKAKTKGIHFVANNIPKVVVDVDAVQISRIVDNLFSNAIKYTESGEVSLDFEIASEKLFLRVIDSGVGVPIYQREQIFSDFFRATNRPNCVGTGLGLSTAMRLARANNCLLEMLPRPNGGSIFQLVIPLNSKSENGRMQVLQSDYLSPGFKFEQSELDAPLHGVRALVADDDPVCCRSMSRLLRRLGAEVASVESLSEIADKCSALGTSYNKSNNKEAQYDLVLADYNFGPNKLSELPNFCQLFAPASGTILVVVSGSSSSLKESLATRIPVLAMQKPVEIRRLRSELVEILNRNLDREVSSSA